MMDPELYKAAIDGTLSETILSAAADSNQQVTGGKKNTILHVAAKSGNLQINTEEEGDDDHPHGHPLLRFLYHQNADGNTPLHVAAKSGHVEMVRFLIVKARKTDAQQKRKLVTMKNFEGDTALHEAVRHNRFEIVKLLIHEDSNLASVLNGYEESPLFMAVDRCFYEIALLILNATAPSNCSFDGRNGMNILHAAVIRAPIPEFVSEVFFKLSSSSMLEKADDFGWIPLHYAAHLGNKELVELFLNHNKSLAYKKNEKGMSALHISAIKGHVDVVRTLINKCPDICELKDDTDRTALHVAVESRDEEVVKFLLESIVFQDLINEKDNEGNTALHIASNGGDLKILQILANDSNIDRGATNKGGVTFVDIILSTNLLNNTEILEIMSELEREVGLLGLERKLIRETKEAENAEMRKQEEKQTEHKKSEEEKRGKDVANLCLLIATIIATATFAAAIQIPGGYDDNGGAILGGKAKFILFTVYDILAFFLSTFSILIQFGSPALGFTRYFTMILTITLTSASLVFMMLAFEQGIKAVLASPGSDSPLLDIPFTVIVTVASILITFSMFFCKKSCTKFDSVVTGIVKKTNSLNDPDGYRN